MTRRITTSTVREAHPYTRSKSPWILGDHSSMYGKLIHYLSGGGMSTFGRTVRQEEAVFHRFGRDRRGMGGFLDNLK